MYRSDLNAGDKSGAILGVAAVHVLLVFMLLHLSGRIDLTQPQSVLRVFDVTQPQPPPPEIVQPERQPERKPNQPSPPSPRNLKSEATEVVAPKPRIALPLPVPMAVSETPGQGTQSTQGASTAGPGTGAGGSGSGTGAGGTGSGGGLAAVRTKLATRPLSGRDFPRDLLRQWPRGAWVFMRFRVDSSGNIIRCILDRGTGLPAIDSQMCAIAQQRLRYRPALDRNGTRVADWAAYGQEPPR